MALWHTANSSEKFDPDEFVNLLINGEIPMDGTNTQDANAGNVAAAPAVVDKFAGVSIPNPDPNHALQELRFGFRTMKDEKTGVETKRPEVNVKIPILNFDGMANILRTYAQAFQNIEATPEDEVAKENFAAAKKEYDLLASAVQGTYEAKIKDYLGDNPGITTQTFPYELFTWTAIANEPESERKGRGIAKEIWEDWLKHYVAIMPAATGKTEANVAKQAAIFAQKLNPLKNHEDKEKIIPKMMEQLTIYMNVAGADAEPYAGCVQFLVEKGEKILKTDQQADLAANLGFAD